MRYSLSGSGSLEVRSEILRILNVHFCESNPEIRLHHIHEIKNDADTFVSLVTRNLTLLSQRHTLEQSGGC